MIARLFYRAMRILTYILILFAAILLLSKLLPFAGEIFKGILNFFKNIAKEFNRIKTLL